MTKAAGNRRRITLLVTGSDAPARNWIAAETRFIDLRNLAILEHALQSLEQFDCDVERVIVDHAAGSEDALRLIANIPSDFVGDILFIREGDSYLSAAARGDGRILRRVSPRDVEFYLQANRMIGMESTATVSERAAPPRQDRAASEKAGSRPHAR